MTQTYLTWLHTMPAQVRCYCQSHKCKGAYVEPSTKQTHERNDLRMKTAISQSIHHGLVHLHQPRSNPPLLKQYPDRGPLLPPMSDFNNPLPISSCMVEQQMLDHGTLTQEDLDIQVHGSALPNLGPNFHSPEVLLQAVDYYTQANMLTANGACPLNRYLVHTLPQDPEQ